MKLVCHRDNRIYDIGNLKDADKIIHEHRYIERYGLYIYKGEEPEDETEEVEVEVEIDEDTDEFSYEYDDTDFEIEEIEVDEDIHNSRLIYAMIDGEWEDIIYPNNELSYDNMVKSLYSNWYHKVKKYIDVGKMTVRACISENIEKVKRLIPTYRNNLVFDDDRLNLRANCEMYGRQNDLNIKYDDTYERFTRRCGDRDPKTGTPWNMINPSRILIGDEVEGLMLEDCRDIIGLLDFAQNELMNKKHYPYYNNFQYDLIQPGTLKILLKRAEKLGRRYPALEDLLRRLSIFNIDMIDTNTEFTRDIYNFIYN